jgi:hypothetical protein
MKNHVTIGIALTVLITVGFLFDTQTTKQRKDITTQPPDCPVGTNPN